MISSVFRPRRFKNGKLEVARIYRGRYRLDGEFGITDISLGTTDKQVALKRLADIIREKELEKAGLIAPKLQRESAQKSLTDHLAEYEGDLKALGRSQSYREHVLMRVKRVMSECSWKRYSDITPDSFVAWRSRDKALSPKTLNEYLNSMNTFLNWLVRQGRFENNPLRNVTKADIRGQQQKRRAFTDDEFNRLINVADKQRLVYLTAAYTGLRLGELRQLVWGDMKLDHPRPHIIARANTTKNRRQATLPIHPRLLEELRKARGPFRPDNEPVFDGCHHAVSARRIIEDMEAARIARVDSMGRKLDFHCLRYTFATKLAQNGVSQRLAQELMRHSDPRLTANIYTDVTQLPTFEAVSGLAWHADSKAGKHIKIVSGLDSQIDSQTLDISGPNEAKVVAFEVVSENAKAPDDQGLCHDLAATGTDQHWRREGDSNPR